MCVCVCIGVCVGGGVVGWGRIWVIKRLLGLSPDYIHQLFGCYVYTCTCVDRNDVFCKQHLINTKASY